MKIREKLSQTIQCLDHPIGQPSASADNTVIAVETETIMKCDTTGITHTYPELQWITWYKDSVLMDNITYTGVITEWRFTPVIVNDTGLYRCSARNIIGPSVMSEPVTITVEGKKVLLNFNL